MGLPPCKALRRLKAETRRIGWREGTKGRGACQAGLPYGMKRAGLTFCFSAIFPKSAVQHAVQRPVQHMVCTQRTLFLPAQRVTKGAESVQVSPDGGLRGPVRL